MRIILAYITVLLSTFAAFGHQSADSVKVYFRIGHSRLDPSFSGNAKVLEDFDKFLVRTIDEGRLDSIVIRGYASPEGVSKANLSLSERRCLSLKDYLVAKTGVDPTLIRTHAGGVAWDELRSLVAAHPETPCRSQVLDILDNVPIWKYGAGGKIVDGKKKRLMDLAGGIPYEWMRINLFPELRNALAAAIYCKPLESDHEKHGPEVEDIAYLSVDTLSSKSVVTVIETEPVVRTDEVDDGRVTNDIEEPKKKDNEGGSSFLMALKTNLLYDAALVPNIGAEFYLGRNFSVYGDWMYAWWDRDRRHRYWRVYGGELGCRWWFGSQSRSKALSGHHVGIYGGIMTFDFEFGEYGYMGGKPGGTLWDRHLVNAGIEYGYSLSVGRRLNIDFSIGLGYLGGKYIKYYPFDNDYYFDNEYSLRYFGPTKAEISLVWLIGHVGPKMRKGGER